MLTLTPGRLIVTEAIRAVRDALYRDAGDHTDLAEMLQAVTIAAEAAHRIREIAAGCARPGPLNEMAGLIEDATTPMETEAMNWDDNRDARAWGDLLDRRRA